jgi:hypothetical protein
MVDDLELDFLVDEAAENAARSDPAHWRRAYDMIADECHPDQRGVVETAAKWWTALVGGRGGKTTSARARLVRRCMSTPRAHCLFVATTRKQCRDLLWEPLQDINDRFDLGMYFHNQDMIARFPNGAWILLFGVDDIGEIRKLRGIPWHEVIIDESGFYPPELLERFVKRVLGPRMSDFPNTSLGLIGTPSHTLRGMFYDTTRPGSTVKGWERHAWSLATSKDEGPRDWQVHANRVWTAALKMKEDEGWSDDHPVWRREYLGLWAADDTEMVFKYRPHDDEGKLFNAWDPDIDPSNGFAKLPGPADQWSYIYAMDEGYKDPFALNVFAFNRHDGDLLHVRAFESVNKAGEKIAMYARVLANMLLGEEHVDKVLRREKVDHKRPGGMIGHTGWPVAMVGDIGEGLANELNNVYGIAVERESRRADYKHDAIELTNGDFIDRRIFVLLKSPLHTQLGDLQWAIDDYGNLKENKGQANHSTDTLIYARQQAFHKFQLKRQDTKIPTALEAAVAKAEASKQGMLEEGRRRRAGLEKDPALVQLMGEWYDPWGDDFHEPS